MQDIIFYAIGSVILLLFLWRMLDLIFKALKVQKRPKWKLKLGKKHLLGLGVVAAIAVIAFSILAWHNASISKSNFVRMNDILFNDIYVAHGKVRKVVLQEWGVENQYGSLKRSNWNSGCTYTYDEKGNVIQIIWHRNTDDSLMVAEDYVNMQRNEFSYNEDGLLSSSSTFDRKGLPSTTSSIEFDKNGYPKFETSFNSNNGQPLTTYKYQIKSSRHWIKEYFDPSSRLTSEDDLEFWSTNIPKKKLLYDIENEERILSSSEKYDRRGLLVSMKQYMLQNEKNEPYLEIEYEREPDGEIKLVRYVNGTRNSVLTPDYRTSDTKENWTELLWFADGQPTRIITRMIEYYE